MTARFKRYEADKETSKFYKTYKWVKKRQEVLIRDNFECQECKKQGRFRPADCVHHIKELKQYPELALDINNLTSLCNRCHNLIHEKHIRSKKTKFINEERW
ncbi:HNH endonuclease [Clostridium botulinum]|uniref:Putative HNH nuclease YajD n=1 Tax=Clostridium botulinum (strain 657 / Type Ba4) TaxID=515621 RepID=A0A3F3A3J9_CLOB6|nr:HNH endonuclease signature motif containing protein [Clostridium botulinum]ACQ52848.1 Gp54 protein [Clostridium botulinum Ba4 str. 657]APU60228.1 HNH endonuclease family protein [Clostridium botulinum]AXG91477.1 HNH endonuclease [Clostridium botulinum]NEZ80897.1 HNH endonuclease [Clostridium botulinum]NFA18268.1 HNH endonuclease [Clostridium botulinum]